MTNVEDQFVNKLSEVTGRSVEDLDISHGTFMGVEKITNDAEEFARMYREEYGGRVDFVYDIGTGYFFINLFANHQVIMSMLYQAYKDVVTDSLSAGADAFVEEGFGVFRSSQSTVVWHGPGVVSKLPSGLKYIWRRDLREL